MNDHEDSELRACSPNKVNFKDFNQKATIPYGCTLEHIYKGMLEFIDFISFINTELHKRGIQRLETITMQANFSSIVGEFMHIGITKHCKTLVKNRYHNGHPDLIPRGMFTNDMAQHEQEGIEIKGSRHKSGWQGHNPEDTWLMVFIYNSNTPKDQPPTIPFEFKEVLGAQLTKDDWSFSGRSATSRRTITAGVKKSGYEKMKKNWIYRAPEFTTK